ncbi:MAG: YcnI family protein [Pseudolysinimonas sp.]
MNTPIRRRLTIGAVAFGAATLLAIATPLSASAHVSLEENTAAPGTFTTLTFRVPNETADGASTNKLTVTLPTDKSLLDSVSYIPVAGWTTQLITTKLAKPITEGDNTITEAITQVIWTANPGSEYGQGSEGQFKLFVGPIPDVGTLSLPVEQGYSDGSTVSWSGRVGSEHPAPVLYIDDAPPVSDDPDSAPETTVTAPHTAATVAGPDVLARALGGVGLLLGAISLVIAIVGRPHNRQQKKVS